MMIAVVFGTGVLLQLPLVIGVMAGLHGPDVSLALPK